MRTSMTTCVAIVLALAALPAWPGTGNSKLGSCLQESRVILDEVINAPDDIPQDLLEKAVCIVVIPWVKKAALSAGDGYAEGLMICRTGAHQVGPWGGATVMALDAGSFVAQFSEPSVDVVVLVMNPHTANSLLSGSLRIGSGSSAPGPAFRDARWNKSPWWDDEVAVETYTHARMLTYSLCNGVFAGVSLVGANLRPDLTANKLLYGRDVDPRLVVLDSSFHAPEGVNPILDVLQARSPHSLFDPRTFE